MTYTVELSKCQDVMRRVARELKTRYSVSDSEIIWPHITQEYGITVKYSDILKENSPPTTVTFPSESFYTFLMLKYYENYE
jgi:hypothetical protein